jgi:hypothetical protein
MATDLEVTAVHALAIAFAEPKIRAESAMTNA